MFLAINPQYDITGEDSTVSHLLDCSNNISPFVTNQLSVIDTNNVLRCFENEIIPSLSQEKLKIIILAMVDTLLQDDFDDTTIIGSITNKTVGEYRTETNFIISEFLADFFLFSLRGIDNKTGKSHIKSVTKAYVDNFEDKKDSITLLSKSSINLPLSKTINIKHSEGVFVEVSQASLGLSNPESFKIFRLKIEDYTFTYDLLHKFLTVNLGRYVHSRAKMEKYRIDDDLESIGLEAAQLLREHQTDKTLGEILLYAFLEDCLNAPKLMSKIELGSSDAICDGIHLLALPSPVSAHQLVFGASNLNGNLSVAIDNAFDSVIKTKTNKSSNATLVESSIFNCSFPDTRVTETIKSIILPSKNNQEPPDSAFGMFLGYSIDLDESVYNLSKDDFVKAVHERLTADISGQVPYIIDKIKTLKLGMHSFYIYVLPFNDMDNDKLSIISKLIGGAK